MAKRNYSQELRRAIGRGCKVVCSMAPFSGVPVSYEPRRVGDPTPWRLRDGSGALLPYRYTGRECHAVDVPGADR